MEMNTPFTIKLDVRQRESYMSAICSDVPGLHLIGDTVEAIYQIAPRAITHLIRANQQLIVRVDQVADTAEFCITEINPT